MEATKDAAEDVERMREMKENTMHNVMISAFHNVQANVRSMEHQVRLYTCHQDSILTEDPDFDPAQLNWGQGDFDCGVCR